MRDIQYMGGSKRGTYTVNAGHCKLNNNNSALSITLIQHTWSLTIRINIKNENTENSRIYEQKNAGLVIVECH